MKVLFDHNLPHKLRTILGASEAHEIVTAMYMGWAELKNGELLRTAEAEGVGIFLTGDRSLVHEQNLAGRQLAVIALSRNNWPILRNHIPKIIAASDDAKPGSFQSIDCGTFRRR